MLNKSCIIIEYSGAQIFQR